MSKDLEKQRAKDLYISILDKYGNGIYGYKFKDLEKQRAKDLYKNILDKYGNGIYGYKLRGEDKQWMTSY